LPYLDGFTGIYADKQAVRVEAIRSDRAAIEFRGLPPAVRDELVGALGDKITVQETGLRTSAAHARWEEFEIGDVSPVIELTRELIEAHLG
jgi:hypothetical protein